MIRIPMVLCCYRWKRKWIGVCVLWLWKNDYWDVDDSCCCVVGKNRSE